MSQGRHPGPLRPPLQQLEEKPAAATAGLATKTPTSRCPRLRPRPRQHHRPNPWPAPPNLHSPSAPLHKFQPLPTPQHVSTAPDPPTSRLRLLIPIRKPCGSRQQQHEAQRVWEMNALRTLFYLRETKHLPQGSVTICFLGLLKSLTILCKLDIRCFAFSFYLTNPLSVPLKSCCAYSGASSARVPQLLGHNKGVLET